MHDVTKSHTGQRSIQSSRQTNRILMLQNIKKITGMFSDLTPQLTFKDLPLDEF